MTSIWQPSPGSEQEFEIMATVLEARHGVLAAQVADFFASLHTDSGDALRSSAWSSVAELVRIRECQRLEQA